MYRKQSDNLNIGMKFSFFIVLCFCYHVKRVEGQADGQKAHFQVHNKEQGKLEIHATKKQAKISVSADSVQLVVNPGTEEVPEEDVTAQTVKVHSIAGNVRSVKRNALPKKRSHNRSKNTEKKRSKLHHVTLHDVGATKKSNVDKEMRVHSQSGALHVHTDHNITTLDSHSGKLEVYIKNPEYFTDKESSEHHRDNLHVDVYTEEAYKKNKFSNKPLILHIVKDVTGLKKSIVRSNKNVARNLQKAKHQPNGGLIPPCSN